MQHSRERNYVILMAALLLLLATLFCEQQRDAVGTPRPQPTAGPTALPEYGPTRFKFAPVKPYVTVVATPRGGAY